MRKKSQVWTKLLIFLLIAIMGFRDTGVFVREFKSNNGNFTSGEKVEILKETDSMYLVKGKDGNLEVPKDNMIRETRSEFTYEVKNSTEIKNLHDETAFRKLREGEVVEAVVLDKDKNVFKTRDGITGVVDLEDLEEIKSENITKATATVDKKLKSGNNTFTIKRGSSVKVKGYRNDKYVVVDMDGNEYLADKNDITLGKIEASPSRGSSIPKLNNSSKAGKLVASAHKELGKPYISGDTGRRGYDCSGLTYALYLNNFGIKLPRTSAGQATVGTKVGKAELQPGDLVFFRTGGRSIGHVGLYIGNNNMIHASSGQKRMAIANINNNYFKPRYVTARRILN